MKLLHKDTLLVERFPDGGIPPFVILSHRWGPNECTLQSFAQECQQPSDRWSAGTAKVMAFCDYVKKRPEQYVWADVCCIDKTSSSELQEAINSMYKWYQQAELCLVYLEDVAANDHDTPSQGFARSQWWTRGWTLQELLAPKAQVFVDREWGTIGTRDELASAIEEITMIPSGHLGNPQAIHATPVAQRMSWIATRRTTVVEDLTYCMLGIFDVNMTMLYGEGMRAFLRLQIEILQAVDDESIFLWTTTASDTLERSSILAPSPACFKRVDKFPFKLHTYFLRDPCRYTSRGLAFEVYDLRSSILADEICVPVNCLGLENELRPCLRLRRSVDNERNTQYWRRIGHEQIDLLPSHHYRTPESERQLYLKEMSAMQLKRHQYLGQSRTHGAPVDHRAMFELQDQPANRRIFIR